MSQHFFSDNSAVPAAARPQKLITGMLLVVFLAASVMGIAAAQETGWTFRFTPYLWAAGMEGDTGIGQTEAEIDLSFGDILEDLNMALMGDFRAENGPWAIESDIVWTDLKSDINRGPLNITVEPRMVFWQLDGRYRVAPQWEVLAGIRYYHVKTSIGIDVLNTGIHVSDSVDWVDPIIGAAFRTPLNDRWSFAAHGNIGGFGVGSDFAWGALAVFDYRFGDTTSVTFGYRHLDWDYDEDNFALDAYLTGPVVGVSFRF